MIGQTVHYVSHGTPVRADGTQAYPARCRAATITEEDQRDNNEVGLCVVNPTGLFFRSLADGGNGHSQTGEPGSWHTLVECGIVHGHPDFGKAV